MTRPGYLVHAEHEARDEAERHGWDEDYLPEREPSQPPAIEDDLMRTIRERALAFEQARRAQRERNAQ